MTLSLAEVFAKVDGQEDPSMGYVFSSPIHYIVLNEDDNKLTISWINKFINILD